MICNWGRADWCSWRRRGGRSGGGGGGGWPLSNGEGGGGDAAAEGAGLGCATRRCHHCTGANSGGGAGSYFPLLPRCCFCRLGRRRRREREGAASPREAAALRTPRRAAGAARCVLRCGAAAQFSPPRDPPPPSWGPQLSLCAAHPHSLSSHTGSASTGPSPRVLPALSYTLAPASPPWAPPPRRAGAAVVPVPGECSVQTKKRAI